MPFAGIIEHKELGTVSVTIRRNSGRVTARWRNGRVNLNVPMGTPLKDINRFLDDFTPQLMAARPSVFFHDGQIFELGNGVTIVICRQNLMPDRIAGNVRDLRGTVSVGTDISFDDPEATVRINDMVLKVARRLADKVLMPLAHDIADSLHMHPSGWIISSGHRILGVCNARGVISLSYVLVFLPEALRRYVICHELAHLLEMNHSPRFHALLDSSLGGREAELTASLRAYTWPILRR